MASYPVLQMFFFGLPLTRVLASHRALTCFSDGLTFNFTLMDGLPFTKVLASRKVLPLTKVLAVSPTWERLLCS